MKDKIEITVPFHISDEFKLWSDTTFPGYGLVAAGNAVNSHPHLHVERLLVEDYMFRTLSRGGGTVLDVGGNPARHSALGRQTVWCNCPLLSAQDVVRNSRYEPGSWCTHKFQDCKCTLFGGAMFVHSVYDIDPKDMFDLCSSKPVMVAIHEFAESVGRYYDEAEYKRSANRVTMSVKGCSFLYDHQYPAWIRAGGYSDALRGQLITNKVREFGNTSVYTVVYSRWVYVRSTEVGIDAVTTVWRAVHEAKDGSSMTRLPCGMNVPLALLNELYFQALSQNHPTSQSLMLYASKWLRTWKSSADCINCVGIAVACVRWVLCSHENVMGDQSGTRGANWFLSMLLRAWNIFLGLFWTVVYNFSYPVRPTMRPTHLSIAGTTCEDAEPTDTYKVVRQPGFAVDKRSEITVAGPVPYREGPVVFNQDDSNTIKSLNERAFAPVPTVDRGLFIEFQAWLPSFWKALFPNVRPVFEPTSFEEWNARFEPAVRVRHKNVYDTSDALTKRDCMLRDCFLKQEVSWDATKPPRLITAVSDKFKICVGPYLHKLSKVIGKKLSNGNIVYAPGKNMTELGSFYDPTLPSISTDMSRFDSSITDDYMVAMLSLYEYFRFPASILQALRHSIGQRCYFRSGLVVEPVVPRRSSGHPNTTLENTMLNLALHQFALERSGNSPRIMAGGDDIIIQGCQDVSFVKTLSALGFLPKPVVCPPGVGRFYSGWFLPTSAGMVLTPFVGRQLSKLGLAVRSKNTYVESVSSLRAVYKHVQPILDLLELIPLRSVEVRRPQYLLSPVEAHMIPETLITLETIYPGFLGIIDDLKKVYVQPTGVHNVAGLDMLLESE